MSVRFSIPEDFRTRLQWVVWRYVKRRSEHVGSRAKPTKVPFQAAKPRLQASTTDAATWARFEHAVRVLEQGGADGVGFVFDVGDPFVGVDLDGCRDPETGELAGWASQVVEDLNSFSEVSPSGKGVHVVARGRWDGNRNRKGGVEVYGKARFFAMTGELLPGFPHSPMPRQRQLDELCARLFPPLPVPAGVGRPAVVVGDDHVLLERMFTARNGGAVERLWRGDWSAYPSQSEADLALLGRLVYWTGGDVARIDTLFRASGLYRPKWDRADYRERSISIALGRPS